jgi:serine/threonine protein kinase
MIRTDNVPPPVFLIDFGLAQQFRNPTTYLHLHKPYSKDHLIIGTLLFTSINGQQGYAQSRHDDLESLAYTIIYSACGDLPWASVFTSEGVETALQKKKMITVEELCKGLPAPFCKFVGYVHSLDFDEKPDYQHLHTILLQCLDALETETDQHREVLPCQLTNDMDSTSISSD